MHTKIAVTLRPVITPIAPVVSVAVPGQILQQTLSTTQRIELDFDAPEGWLEVVFANKPDHDPEMAVIVEQVEFFGITDPRFVWAGIYTPQYPEPWYSQQSIKPPQHLPQQNYMGWNGSWRLDFTVPVFTWMHKIMHLGWLYH